MKHHVSDDVQELNRQREELSCQHENRRHVQVIQEPHDRQTGHEKRPQWCDGYIERSGKEFVAKTMRRVGCCIRHNQAILPRRWKRFEKSVLG